MHAGTTVHATPAIHTAVDRWGMRAEVVTAESPEGLAQYLREKGGTPDAAKLSAFEPYMSDQYVLVVAWIASRAQACASRNSCASCGILAGCISLLISIPRTSSPLIGSGIQRVIVSAPRSCRSFSPPKAVPRSVRIVK